MNLVLRYAGAQRVDALLLAVGRGTLRVVARGESDATELRQLNGQWLDEQNRLLELEAATVDGMFADATIAELFPRTKTA